MTDAARVLRQAAELVGRGWTQEASARDPNGAPVNATDPDACAWCSTSAIYLGADAIAPPGRVHDLYLGARWVLAEMLDVHTVTTWNDAPERTQQDVVAALLRAAEIAEGEGG